MKAQIIEFDSEDTEGSDLSYESSFDDRLDQENQQLAQQRNIAQFKDQMNRFMMQNPDLQGQINLETANFVEDDVPIKTNPPNRRFVAQSKSVPAMAQPIQKWDGLSSNILNQAKKVTMPSLEEFQQRLNLFRRKVDKSDIVDLIISEQSKILKDIAQQAKRQKARDNALHETIKAKVNKETGNIGYISYRKRVQFQFKIQKAEELAQEKVDKQKQKKEVEMKKSRGIFDKLFQEKKSDDPEAQVESEFKSQAAEELYRKIKRCNDETEIKETIIQFVIAHRKKMNEDYWSKPSLLQQGTKFYTEESKEFSLLAPNFAFKKAMQGKIPKDFFENKDALEDSNFHLLTKVNKMLDGHLMKYWKKIQETKI